MALSSSINIALCQRRLGSSDLLLLHLPHLLRLILLVIVLHDIIPNPNPIPAPFTPNDIHPALEVLRPNEEHPATPTRVGIVRWLDIIFLLLSGEVRGRGIVRVKVFKGDGGAWNETGGGFGVHWDWTTLQYNEGCT